jgi:hypothetical protein
MIKAYKTLAITGTNIMFMTLVYGYIASDFFREGNILVSLEWGKVSLIDVYIGFLLFSGWVLFREEKWTELVLRIICGIRKFYHILYATVALYKSQKDFKRF